MRATKGEIGCTEQRKNVVEELRASPRFPLKLSYLVRGPRHANVPCDAVNTGNGILVQANGGRQEVVDV